MRHLIIGCGYLGRRVAQRWRAAGDHVLAVTRTAERSLELAKLGLFTIGGDVTDRRSLDCLHELARSRLLNPSGETLFDTVLHAVGYDRTAAASKREVYVAGLSNVLDAVRDCCRRVIHISSTSVYAQQDGELVDETSECVATEESGCICRDAEQLVRDFAAARSLPVCNILRLSGIYGPGRLLSRVEAIQAGASMPGPRDSWLNLIHVDDAAAAVLACAERGRPGETYLVSDDRPVLRHEYYERLAELLSAPAPTFDEAAVARHTRGRGKRCVNQKLRDDLQVELQYPSIDAGLRQALGR